MNGLCLIFMPFFENLFSLFFTFCGFWLLAIYASSVNMMELPVGFSLRIHRIPETHYDPSTCFNQFRLWVFLLSIFLILSFIQNWCVNKKKVVLLFSIFESQLYHITFCWVFGQNCCNLISNLNSQNQSTSHDLFFHCSSSHLFHSKLNHRLVSLIASFGSWSWLASWFAIA